MLPIETPPFSPKMLRQVTALITFPDAMTHDIGGTGAPTPFGLKLMAFLCGTAFVVFLKYPLREHEGKVRLRTEK